MTHQRLLPSTPLCTCDYNQELLRKELIFMQNNFGFSMYLYIGIYTLRILRHHENNDVATLRGVLYKGHRDIGVVVHDGRWLESFNSSSWFDMYNWCKGVYKEYINHDK